MKKIIKKHFGLAKELIEIGAGQNMFVRCYPLLGEVPLVIDRKQDTKVEIPKTKKLALFVYVPFCTGKCSYCFYSKKINPNQKEIEEYLVLLEKEMASWSMGINNAFVAWVQMISPLNPASIMSGALPM